MQERFGIYRNEGSDFEGNKKGKKCEMRRMRRTKTLEEGRIG